MNDEEILNYLLQHKSELEKVIKDAERRLKTAPEGSVYAMKHGRGYAFYVRKKPSDRKATYLPASEHKQAVALIQKRYDQQIILRAEEQLKVTKRFLRNYKPNIFKNLYSSLSEIRRKSIIPVEISDAEYITQWQAVEFRTKDFPDDMPEHFTSKGERVRSKSEVMIANAMFEKGIPYRYEYPIVIGGITFHPDFTVLRISDRKEMHWEHLGMMDDPEYFSNCLGKIRIYERNDYLPGKNMIYTMETSQAPLNITVINRMIEAYLM